MPSSRWFQISIAVLCVGPVYGAGALDYRVEPSPTLECQDQLSRTVALLGPGDTLHLGAGRYTQSCNRVFALRGTAAEPIIIYTRHAGQAVLYRSPDDLRRLNNLELVDSEHVVIRGLHFVGGSIGVRIMGGHHLVLEDSLISDTGTTALGINYSNAHHLTVRNNEIARTGLADNASGEGIYVGCHDATCIVTDSLFADNYIHDLRGDRRGGNDGIEIKAGSGGNIVRSNRIDNTLIDAQFPCIFAYGGGRRPNLIEGNLLTRCGEAIQVVADAVVRNNIIYNAKIAGIVSAAHRQNRQTRHVYIANNTIIDTPVCAILNWRDSKHMVFANNALFCSSTDALHIVAAANGLLLNNGWSGALKGISNPHNGLFPLRPPDDDLERPPDGKFSPSQSSRLRRRANISIPGAPGTDYFGRTRNNDGFATVGAIE